MGLYLMAINWTDPMTLLNILLAIIGLGMVIFVHELGHFLVAKLCGVKCEKFYLGFDIGGLKLAKFKWGETEYGIGILPLGGYVKMLGQEDNPARLREEMERAKAQNAQPVKAAEAQAVAVKSDAAGGNPGPAPVSGASQSGEKGSNGNGSNDAAPTFDPRSYLAQSVPERLAIISAGVVMNVIFAVIMGAVAYWLGVFHVSCGVGGVSPGAAAWQGNLRPGDKITEINGRPVQRFMDLKAVMSVGNVEGGVPITIERPGVPKPFTVTLYPNQTKPVPTIGVAPPNSTRLYKDIPVMPGSAAARGSKPFLGDDRIVEINGQPIANYADVNRQLALHPTETLTVTVERTPPSADGKPKADAKSERVTIQVPPMPMTRLGLVMPMGPITAVQADSPAAKAGLQPGDLITQVDDQPPGDPMTLPDRLRRRALTTDKVRLTVQREGSNQPIVLESPLRQAGWYEVPMVPGNPLSAPALGIAYQVPNRVERVIPGSPAAKAGLQGGEVIVQAKVIPPAPESVDDENLAKVLKMVGASTRTTDFTKKNTSWPSFFYSLQETDVVGGMFPGSKVELKSEDERTFTLEPAKADDWFNPERGFQFESEGAIVQADSVGSALRYGAQETGESMTLVFQLLGKIASRFRAMGGPLMIFKMAYLSASQGPGDLSLFLMMISANLAVINFLPIPVLDGGHVVFLLYEGITGKPPDERVHVALTYAGLILILGLMVLVLGLDFGLISRN